MFALFAELTLPNALLKSGELIFEAIQRRSQIERVAESEMDCLAILTSADSTRLISCMLECHQV